MKFFVVALSLVAICSTFTVDDDRNLFNLSQDCANEQGITQKELDEYHRYIEKFVDEAKAQNFCKCVFQKFGWIDQIGEFQESAAIKSLSRGNYIVSEENVKQCTATAGDNKANAFILKFVVCFKEAYYKS